MNDPLVTLLLPNYNNDTVLDMFFTKLLKNTRYENYELIVVDDGSTDRSLEILKRWEKSGQIRNMRVVENEHHGVPRTLNDGLKLAKGKYICRLDGDATVETPGWLQKITDFTKTDTRIGMVVAKILYPGGRLHSAGRKIICPEGLHNRGEAIAEQIGARTLDCNITRVRNTKQFDHISEVDTALGCCTLFTRDIADRIGEFDENFTPVWIEDDDFGLSVRKHNKKVFYFPGVTVVHHIYSRLPRNITKKSFQFQIASRLLPKIPPQAREFVIFLMKVMGQRKTTGQSQWRINVLQHHYKYWEEKWGFSPLNPDIEEIKSKWGHTEICWSFVPSMKRQGEEIIRDYLARNSQASRLAKS